MKDKEEDSTLIVDEDKDQYYTYTSNGKPSGAKTEGFWESLGIALCPKISWS